MKNIMGRLGFIGKRLLFRYGNNRIRIFVMRKNGISIGTGGEIAGSVQFGSEPYLIKIGDNVRITRNVSFITHDGGLWVLRNMKLIENADRFGRIVIGNNVHIGWNVTIMPGVTIGDNCIIGVGAVVTKDIPDNSIAAGIPARIIENIEEYFHKNKDRVVYTKHMKYEEKKKFLWETYGKDNI